MYYIYHIPTFKRKNGKNGKIGCTEEPDNRVNRQGYNDYEIIEEHTDIMIASQREIELQKQYGYPVDCVPYYKSRNKWGSVAGKKGGEKCKKNKIGFLADDFDRKNAQLLSVKSRKLNGNYNEIKKPVLQFTKDGKFIKEWESMSHAAKSIGCFKQTVSQCCRGIRKTGAGYVWKYKEE